MKEVRTEAALGLTLVHDITRIIKGEVKDTPFRKGHVITEEDIPKLLSLGKDHVYVFSESDEGLVHENEAAKILASLIKGPGLDESEVREGKIELISQHDGFFFTDGAKLIQLNMMDKISASCVNTARRVKKGDRLIGFRVIPLMIEKSLLDEAVKLGGPMAEVRESKALNFSVITTGNEVYYGRIKDTFTEVVEEKLGRFGCRMTDHVTLPDDAELIAEAVRKASDTSDLVIVTGGMSVDPDDRTPLAIRKSGAEIVSYGSPVLPGSMMLVSYRNGIPVLGLPGCVMYNKITVFDLVLPFVLTGKKITRKYLASLATTGFCTNCKPCIYPDCHFGKGGESEL